MKHTIYLSVLYILLAITGCSGNKDTEKKDDTRVVMGNTTDAQGLQRMQVSQTEQTISFKGKDYMVHLTRTPNDELPLVESEVGDMFVDNTIKLRITQGTKEVFNQTLTKRNFSSVVGESFLKKSILEGMVFDKTTPQGMVFAVSVSYPQTDLFFPITVAITADGKMSMKKDELMEEIYTADE